jgi:hypothetical protein
MPQIPQIVQAVKYPVSLWKRIGGLIQGWLNEDSLSGKMQNDTSNHQYSKEYAAYKANNMHRLTHGGNNTIFHKSGDIDRESKVYMGVTGGKRKYQHERTGSGQNMKTEKRLVPGDRLKAYSSKKIASNDTSHVTMILTGETLEGLKIKEATETHVIMSYDPKDADKIIGNRNRGYDIVGLSEENRLKVREEIVKQTKQQFSELQKIHVKINIGKK